MLKNYCKIMCQSEDWIHLSQEKTTKTESQKEDNIKNDL